MCVTASASDLSPIMAAIMPKLYIDEFVGISNRLETLPLAFALRQAYGHEIILDWHELDAFHVEGTRRGKVRLLARLGAQRVRDCDAAMFASLAGKKIILRSLDGPGELLDALYLQTAARLKLVPALRQAISSTLARVHGRPLVGVHIRQGDYQLNDAARYDIGSEWPAVPTWWYQRLMAAIRVRQPDVCFYLSCTGDPAAFAELFAGFEVISLDLPSPYRYKGEDHRSAVHPVADLFALACCPLLLATPISGYSHWAANALGPPSTCLVPLPGATPEDARAGVVRLHGQRLPRWRAAGRSGTDTLVIANDLAGLDCSATADLSWL